MIVTDILLALSLAADAFMVSLAVGITHHKTLARWQGMAIALCFGGFQTLMPLVGWKLGMILYTYIEPVDHWIAFGLLVAIGLNMMRNALWGNTDHSNAGLTVRTILALGVATSIDALAVGFTLPTISVAPIFTIITIGVVTTGLCWLAFLGAARIPKIITNRAEILAGIILVALGCKILIMSFYATS